MLSFSPVGPSTSAITTGGSHRQISCNGSLLRVKVCTQTPNGQVFTTHNGLLCWKSQLHPYVLELLHRWVRPRGDSVEAFESRMLPGDEEEFVPDGCNYPQLWAMVCVDRVQMTAWTEVEETQIKRHYLRRVVPRRCPNKGCTQPLQRPKHLVWDRFSHISWSVKIHLKERRSLKGASFKQKFFSGLQVIIFFVGCVNLKIQCEGSGSYTLVKDNIQVLSLLWQRNTSKIDPSADNHHLFPVRLRWVAKTHPGEVPLFSVWIICVDIRALLYLQHHSLTHASRRNSK